MAAARAALSGGAAAICALLARGSVTVDLADSSSGVGEFFLGDVSVPPSVYDRYRLPLTVRAGPTRPSRVAAANRANPAATIRVEP